MAKRERIIEGTWKCTSCETAGIPGSQKVCPTCGNPREDEEAKFDFGATDASGKSSAATVTDTAKLELAAAGADWYCANCGTANAGTATKCKSCGTEDADARLARKPEKPKQAAPPPPKASSGAAGLAGGVGCFAIGGGLLALLACTGVLGWFLFFRTSEMDASVQAMHWSRDVSRQTFTAVTKQGWKSEIGNTPSRMPVNGAGEKQGTDNIRACVTKEKVPAGCEDKTRQVQCGTEEKCHQQDLGNGFAKEVCDDVPKYCDEKYKDCHDAIKDDYCTYDTYAWQDQGPPAHAEGNDNQPKWPSAPAPGPLDRLVKTEKYDVTIAYPDGTTATWEPADEAAFTKVAPSQKVVVRVTAVGTVTDATPK